MSLNTPFIAELKQESANTRKMLERVPVNNPAWKPHEKSMTIGRLSQHIAHLPAWITHTLKQDEFDLAKRLNTPESFNTNGELLHFFDNNVAEAIKSLTEATDEEFSQPWILRNGNHIYFTMPRKVVLRTMAFSHIVHHRGQLSVYLRLLDINVPGMYGPSADEQEMMASQ